jgi:ribosomal protein S18 acetylase RimI-like enzyme
MTAAVTEIGDDDIPAVVALWQRCNLVRPWNDPVEDIRLARESGHGAVLVARVDGRLAGAVMTGHDGHRGAVYYLGVDPAERRHGLGRALVASAEEWCRTRGVPKINLLVRKENLGVLSFYDAIGYRDTRTVCLYRTLDDDKAEHEAALKDAWAARLAQG